MYLYCNVGMCNVGMCNITMLPYSEYCNVLILSVYMYEYYTLRMYIAVAFPYPMGAGGYNYKINSPRNSYFLDKRISLLVQKEVTSFMFQKLVTLLYEPFIDLSNFTPLDILVNLDVILLTQSTTKFIASRYLISFYS